MLQSISSPSLSRTHCFNYTLLRHAAPLSLLFLLMKNKHLWARERFWEANGRLLEKKKSAGESPPRSHTCITDKHSTHIHGLTNSHRFRPLFNKQTHYITVANKISVSLVTKPKGESIWNHYLTIAAGKGVIEATVAHSLDWALVQYVFDWKSWLHHRSLKFTLSDSFAFVKLKFREECTGSINWSELELRHY